MNEIELLAPAKNLDTAIAAIHSGADAIYIGASQFGARVNAPNSLEDIEKLVNFAHKFYVKVHVAINTILNNSELNDAINLIKDLDKIGVDAIIIQDTGILKAAIENKIPNIELHMSTQCDNRTLEKVKFFDAVGVSRVILARELSIDKIREICKNVSCEVETFVHGALCVSYSGQCYMSYCNGGRSANRGECAQPCRKVYSLVDSEGKVLLKNKHLLSLKDFNASEHLKELVDCGVKSFKIEGRLKDENYVKNNVLYYNNLLNAFAQRTSSGKVFADFVPNPSKTFNRGFTSYFLKGRGKCFNFTSPKSIGEYVGKVKTVSDDYIVIEGEKISSQDGLCFIGTGRLEGFLVNKVVGNKIYPNKMPKILPKTKVYRNFDYNFDRLLTNSKTCRKIGVKYLVKSNKIYVFDEDNNCVSIQLPKGDVAKNLNNMKQTLATQLEKLGNSDFYHIETVFEDDEIPFLPLSKINELRRELLSLLTEERLRNYRRKPQKPIGYVQFPMREVDYHANIYNDEAKYFYENCNVNVKEFALEYSKKIPSGIELMRTKHCLKYAAGLCGSPSNKLFLLDEKRKYPLKFDCKNCEMVILSP